MKRGEAWGKQRAGSNLDTASLVLVLQRRIMVWKYWRKGGGAWHEKGAGLGMKRGVVLAYKFK